MKTVSGKNTAPRLSYTGGQSGESTFLMFLLGPWVCFVKGHQWAQNGSDFWLIRKCYFDCSCCGSAACVANVRNVEECVAVLPYRNDTVLRMIVGGVFILSQMLFIEMVVKL